MSTTVETVKGVAHLARLEFDEGELVKFTSQFNSVINLIETINQVDTGGVEPMANALELTQRLREDKVSEGNSREELMGNAAEVEAGLFMVPKVVE